MSFEEELQSGLRSPEPSFRLASIDSAIREGNSRKVLDILLAHQSTETNDECFLLLRHAIDSISRRVSPDASAALSSPKTLSIPQFIQDYQKGDPAMRLRMLSEIRGRLVTEFAPHAPTLLNEEKHPLVSAAIIKTFGSHWPREDLRNLLLKLGSNHLSLRLASLEVLVKRIPQDLSASLPRLLISPDARIRGLAIRGLAAIDLSEALEHNEYLLASDSNLDKQVGIENSFYFPFERVKALLLRALARENDPVILNKIGSLFAINPDIEVPYRLWEMVDISSPEKSIIIKGIIKDACLALEKGGRLSGEDFQKYQENLSNWAQQRYATRFVQDCISRLSAGEQDTAEVETLISKNIELPYVRHAFSEALKWPLKAEVRTSVEESLAKPPSTAPAALPGDEVGVRQEIRRISLLQNLDRKQARQEIEKVVAGKTSDPAVVATAFRTAGWLEMADFVDAAAAHLQGGDPIITSSVIEYLNLFGFDKLLPHLEEFIRSDDLKIKVAALKALKKKSPAEALRILRTMLSSPDVSQQKSALASMVHMDFPLVRETISAFLEGNPAPELFNDALCLFSANPDPQNLHELQRLTRSLDGESAAQVRETIQQTEERLLDNGQITPIELEERNERIQEELDAEEEKEQNEPAPYSLKVLVPDSQPRDLWRGKPSKKPAVEDHKLNLVLVSASALLLVLLFLGHQFSDSFAPMLGQRQPKEFQGRVLESRPGYGILIEAENGKKILIQPDSSDGRIRTLVAGEQFKGFLVPVRIATDGIIVSRFHSWKK